MATSLLGPVNIPLRPVIESLGVAHASVTRVSQSKLDSHIMAATIGPCSHDVQALTSEEAAVEGKRKSSGARATPTYRAGGCFMGWSSLTLPERAQDPGFGCPAH
jgi:uncharacterized protein YwlG (UPF0340 family)